MDKIFEYGDIFSPPGSSFNFVLILPILVVTVGVVVMFVFCFKQPKSPKFMKSSEQISASSSIKKSKRNPLEVPEGQNMTKPVAKASLKAKTQKRDNSTARTEKTSTTKSSISAHKNRSGPPNPSSYQKSSKNDNKNTKLLNNKRINTTKEKKAGSKNVEKHFDYSSSDGGEWKTVITKKQKKATNDLLIQAVAEAAAGATVKTSEEKATEEKYKQAKDEANKTKNTTFEKQQENNSLKVSPEKLEVTTTVANTTKQNNADQTILTEASRIVVSPESSVIFDEIGDDNWTEPKPPKKSKKRALRE